MGMNPPPVAGCRFDLVVVFGWRSVQLVAAASEWLLADGDGGIDCCGCNGCKGCNGEMGVPSVGLSCLGNDCEVSDDDGGGVSLGIVSSTGKSSLGSDSEVSDDDEVLILANQ